MCHPVLSVSPTIRPACFHLFVNKSCVGFLLLVALIAVLFFLQFFGAKSRAEYNIFLPSVLSRETELAQPAVWKAPYGPLIA